MIRCKYNPAFPYTVTMMKHAPFVATPKSVKGHESRPDGRAIAADTGYQSNFRYGAQQSITRSWLMPMHQLDSLPCKKKHRSEEHTSELQSRLHLVCRLLLEKKKKKKMK